MSEAAAPARATWPREWVAGASAAAATLPLMMTLGVLAFAGTGAAAARLGFAAALANLVGALLAAVLSRAPMPTAGPTSATAVIFAGLIATLAADPQLDASQATGAALLLALGGLAVVGAGLLMLAMAALRLGVLARYVPQPVLAGFMNGIALVILAAQIRPLLGLGSPLPGWLPHAAPLLLGAATAALSWALARRLPRWPSALAALVAGTLLAGALEAAFGLPLLHLQPVAAAHPAPLTPSLWSQAAALLQQHGVQIALTALLLALLGSLETVLNIAATEAPFGFRSDPNRELMAVGAANVVTGLLGGMPVVFLRLRAVATWSAGGRTRLSAGVGAALLIVALLLVQPLAAWLPLAVLAGLMVVIAFSLIDRWSHQLLQRWWAGERSASLRESLVVAALVAGVTLWQGFVAGVAAGIVLAGLLFIRSLRRPLLRARFDGRAQPSRRVYPPALEAVLDPLRERIEVVELEGALFFGNTDHLLDLADAALAQQRQVLILDLRRISSIEASGTVALDRLAQRLKPQCRLWLAGALPEQRHGAALRSYGVPEHDADGTRTSFADIDRALEAAEQLLLAAAGRPFERIAVPLASCALLHGLVAAQQQRLSALLQRRELQAGELLFAEGDAGNGLFVLTEGSISIVGSADADGRTRHRFVSFSPGMALGETAVLDGGGRTADAVADTPCTLYELRAEALQRLQQEHPDVAAIVYRNLARHLSERLRGAAAAWRRAAG